MIALMDMFMLPVGYIIVCSVKGVSLYEQIENHEPALWFPSTLKRFEVFLSFLNHHFDVFVSFCCSKHYCQQRDKVQLLASEQSQAFRVRHYYGRR